MTIDKQTAAAAARGIAAHATIIATKLENNATWPGDVSNAVRAIEQLLTHLRAAEGGSGGYEGR